MRTWEDGYHERARVNQQVIGSTCEMFSNKFGSRRNASLRAMPRAGSADDSQFIESSALPSNTFFTPGQVSFFAVGVGLITGIGSLAKARILCWVKPKAGNRYRMSPEDPNRVSFSRYDFRPGQARRGERTDHVLQPPTPAIGRCRVVSETNGRGHQDAG